VAVAFTLRSGLDLLYEHFLDLLDRGGQLRFLTGDYLDVTDPQALRRLLDLGDRAELKIYETASGNGFHPKSYICSFPDGSGVAYIGSSNVTKPALTDSVEWNYRAIRLHDEHGFEATKSAFNKLFQNPTVKDLSENWIDRYQARRQAPVAGVSPEVVPDFLPEVPAPHEVQADALTALKKTRAAGNTAGLVVLATGLGKTWLSAFDSNRPGEFDRILFVAHRDEILSQALKTFRAIRPDASLGRYTGKEKDPDADVLFASIQTIGRIAHLRDFSPLRFDYIIVDEFHHAAAATYRKLIDYFEPKFLLGLTATPERTDGGDLLGLCQENLVFRYDLAEGVNSGLLSPFHYYGVPDEVDYENIPWRGRRFDPEALTREVATLARANNALEQYRKRAGKRTLAFCCSQLHADFTAEFFRNNGLNAVAVHAGEKSAPRAASLERLAAGELDIVCAVDMFNEGVDVPNIDTVMLLRPTESSILWTQQIGRGLRKAEGKPHLTIIDYIGNHKSFLTKPKTLLQLGSAPGELGLALMRIEDGTFQLPAGCAVTYELEALNILRSLLPSDRAANVIRSYYEEFRGRLGQRPSALEAFHDGYNPKRTGLDSWLSFVEKMGDLSSAEEQLHAEHRQFFESVQKTQMTKSFKMVTLLAVLNSDSFPGSIGIDVLVNQVRRIVSRSAKLQEDFGSSWQDDAALRRLLEQNPIAAWVGARGTAQQYFRYENSEFSTSFSLPDEAREDFQGLTRELADWRLAEYLQRSASQQQDAIVCKVIQSSGKPIIKLPDDDSRESLPQGWAPIIANDEPYEANFVKIAVNVIRQLDANANVLPALLRAWFGPNAGQPGTRFSVEFRQDDTSWVMSPVGHTVEGNPPQLWRRYSREQIPPLYGLEFSTGAWNQGFVRKGDHTFLLVTLEKADLAEDFGYQDYFIDPSTFHWQSQNRTTQESAAGESIKEHAKKGISIHLYVRKQKKEANKAAPFLNCGEVDFVSWEGNKPISVTWRLREAVPDGVFNDLKT
jgi:superfamily II DNA or RNA helicase